MDINPDFYKEELNFTNYWVETGLDGKFFFVDGSYMIIVLMSAINLWSLTTLLILLGSFLIFSLLAKLDLTIAELAYRGISILAQKKYRRY